mgnify:CR=1 FL=1
MSEETDDMQGLIAKRDELLGEVKKLKARVAELEAERDTAKARADTAEGDLHRVKLDEPVESVLGDLFTIKLRHALPEVKDHFDFALGEDGAVHFTDKEGQPVTLVEDGREAGFNADDIRKALTEHGGFDEILRAPGAGGGGKPPNSGGQGVSSAPQEPKRVAPSFGLR